jgi:NH3-dependent NAD+ synthetase
MKMKQPKNNHEALVLALKLSITAATEEKSKQAVELAESIANNMTDIEIARAKKECMTQLEKEQ